MSRGSPLRAVTAAAAAMLLLGVSCGPGERAVPRDPDLLRLGTATGIDSMNPFVAISQDSYATFELIYPQLVQYGQDLQFAPDLAVAWSSSTDGTVWTFRTRAGARWSDGAPLTAADAAWTFSTIVRLADGPAASQAGKLAHLAAAEAPDDSTLVLTYDTPVANVLSNLQQLPVLPPQVWAQYAAGDGEGLRSFDNTPAPGRPVVCGGPFELVTYKRKRIALFRRNPNWYGPQPRMTGFGLQSFASDDAMVAALRDGSIDAVESLPVTAVAALRTAGLTVSVSSGLEFRDLIFNSNPAKPRRRELLEPAVREALEAAIDRSQIVATAWLGYGRPGDSIIPPASGGGWHHDSLRVVAYDPSRANQLLDSLGYARGADGVRVAGDHPMRYPVIIPDSERGAGDRAFQIIRRGFGQVGVQVEPRYLDTAAAWEALTAPDGKYLEFDLAMWDWVPLIDPDFMLSVMTCEAYNGWNDSGYCSPEYDQLYEASTRAVDPVARRRLVQRMQELLYRDKPYIVLNYNDAVDAWSGAWSGFGRNPQGIYNALTKHGFLTAHRR